MMGEKNLTLAEEIAKEEKEEAKKLKKEQYLSMSESEFRAFFRQRVHVTLERCLFWFILRGAKLNPRALKTTKELISIWKERSIPTDKPDFLYAEKVLKIAEDWINGKTLDFSKFIPYSLTESEVAAFDHVIRERRSIRAWTNERVPDEVIRKLLTAGSWAAHSCNMQSIRYIVVREENAPGLVPEWMPEPGPVHILILQDERTYNANSIMPIRNRLLDAGAAAQNIILAAHAYGLGGVWLTHMDRDLKKLSEYFNLESYMRITTYVDVGYPGYFPPQPGKMGLEDIVLKWI